MKVMSVFGTRPEGIKMAPLLKQLEAHPEIESVFVNTGQHAELLDQVLELFSITPQYNLKLMRENQSLATLTARIIEELHEIILQEKPDVVLVHGDTTTTFAASYTAFLTKTKVGHVEAGLRTYHLDSPFPEEANRQLTGRLADFHFAATEQNRKHLLQEGIADEKIFVVGNTVIDALFTVTANPQSLHMDIERVFETDKKTILMTTHRRENLAQLKDIYAGILEILSLHEDVQVVFPVHRNPIVLNQAKEFLQDHPRVILLHPLDYVDFVHAMKLSHFIITDSGGIQEEAPSLGKPVLVARNTTERQEGVEAGTLKLIGTSKEQIVKEGNRLLTDSAYYHQFSSVQNPYGDGKTSERIVHILQNHL